MALDDRFATLLEQLQEWKRSPQGRRVRGYPANAVTVLPDGTRYEVGERARRLRSDFKRDELAADRVQALEELEEWSWEQSSVRDPRARWMEKAEALADYARAQGSLDGLRKANPTLHRWLYAQRGADLDPDQVRLLEAIPGAVPSGPAAGTLETFTHEIAAWSEANPGVPCTHIPPGTLDSQGLNLHRRARHYRQRYRAGSLSPKEIGAIESATPAWRWNEAMTPVERYLLAARAWLEENPTRGITEIPYAHTMRVSDPDGIEQTIAVGALTSTYRRRAFYAAESGLDREELSQLGALRGWAPIRPGARRSRAEQFASHARTWLANNPDKTMADMPTTATVSLTDGTTFAVGRSAAYYRARLAANKLDGPSRDLLLSLPGFYARPPRR